MEWLKGKMFGLPRWAWLGLLAAGLLLALLLRYRPATHQPQEPAAGRRADASQHADRRRASRGSRLCPPSLPPSRLHRAPAPAVLVDTSLAGLVLLGLAEVPQVMSAFLPSPATARMGFNEGE